PVRLSAFPPVRLSACPPVRLSACPPVRLSALSALSASSRRLLPHHRQVIRRMRYRTDGSAHGFFALESVLLDGLGQLAVGLAQPVAQLSPFVAADGADLPALVPIPPPSLTADPGRRGVETEGEVMHMAGDGGPTFSQWPRNLGRTQRSDGSE